MRNPFRPIALPFSLAEDDCFERGRESRQVKAELIAGTCTSQRVDDALKRSAKRTCKPKIKYTTETSAKKAVKSHPGLLVYECPNKSSVHFHIGHRPTWVFVAKQKLEDREVPVVKLIKSIKTRLKIGK